MERIKFRQFIEAFNFRDYYISERNGTDFEDTRIIRINISQLFGTNDCKHDCWFELGVYDFSASSKLKILENALSKKILNSYISDIQYSLSTNTLEISLSKEANYEDR